MASREWGLGERLLHAGKPEWGIGEVKGARSVLEDGQRCQRLTVRFDRAGIKTLSTLFADLRAADSAPAMPAAPSPDDPFADAAGKDARELLEQIPEAAQDPFRSKRARLEATLDLYRFTSAGSSLLDWAAMQSGLADPLTRFNRHELEDLFARFRNNLDAHLRRLVGELRKEDPATLAQVVAAAPPSAQQMLKRLDARR